MNLAMSASSNEGAGLRTDLLAPLLGEPEPAPTPVPPPATASKSSSPRVRVMGACATLIVIAGYVFGGDFLIGREARPNSPAAILLSKPPAYNVAAPESEWNSTRDALIEYLEAVTFFPGDGFIGKGALAITDPATLKQMNGVPGRWLRVGRGESCLAPRVQTLPVRRQLFEAVRLETCTPNRGNAVRPKLTGKLRSDR